MIEIVFAHTVCVERCLQSGDSWNSQKKNSTTPKQIRSKISTEIHYIQFIQELDLIWKKHIYLAHSTNNPYKMITKVLSLK